MNQKSSFRSFLRLYRYAKKWRIKIFFATFYSIINKLSKLLSDKYGDLIISGGDVFNIHMPKEKRIITTDIDTKFIPRLKNISVSSKEYFEYLQLIKLKIKHIIVDIYLVIRIKSNVIKMHLIYYNNEYFIYLLLCNQNLVK